MQLLEQIHREILDHEQIPLLPAATPVIEPDGAVHEYGSKVVKGE